MSIYHVFESINPSLIKLSSVQEQLDQHRFSSRYQAARVCVESGVRMPSTSTLQVDKLRY